MVVKIKDKKLGYKLYTDTSFCVKIFTQKRPFKSKRCVEGGLFTVNTHHSSLHKSNQCY